MTIFTRRMANPLARALSISGVLAATLLGTTSFVSPVFAQSAATAPTAATTAEEKAETVEQRISSLHDMLQITPAQESLWTPVAQTMRDNAADMEKLVSAKKMQSAATMTALDDLMNYQTFAQARVDASKKLSETFGALYKAMPDSQKAIADETFRSFGSKNAKHG
jgi:hypothetical protein